jgi:hypothetical protein
MKSYTIWFEFFGKKMKTTVLAQNQKEAREKLWNKIIVHQVRPSDDDFINEFFDLLKGGRR